MLGNFSADPQPVGLDVLHEHGFTITEAADAVATVFLRGVTVDGV